ncbi:MAG: sugar phosphate isomerase/epimerase family protein [Blastopirellula sp. JB062]
MPLSRRSFLQTGLSAAGSLAFAPPASFADGVQPAGCTLGFSTYGMKTLKTETAIQEISQIGFDAVEITIFPDWDSAPANLPPQRRAAIKRLIQEKELRLTSLMEHLQPSRSAKQHQRNLDRLKRAFELSADLGNDAKPLVQTTLGGGDWRKLRSFYLDRIGIWTELANQYEVVLAVKPHRGGGMSRPSEAAWLIRQLGEPPYLKMTYDYSHYAFRDMPIEETVAVALPYAANVALKDVAEQDGKYAFRLAGETGNVDYPKLFQLFYAGGYRGDFCGEVSGMIWNKPDYDPRAAARQVYARMSKALQDADVPRV